MIWALSIAAIDSRMQKQRQEELATLLRHEARQVEATAKLRDEDYQLAYAIDILKGLSAVDYRASDVPAEAKPALTGEDATSEDAVQGETDAQSGAGGSTPEAGAGPAPAAGPARARGLPRGSDRARLARRAARRARARAWPPRPRSG